MIVINKKRITAILTCILVGVFVFILETSDKLEISDKEKATIETVTLPVSGKTVVIDARTWNTRRTEQKVQKERQKRRQI